MLVCVAVCMCVYQGWAVKKSQEMQRRGRDIMAGRGSEMWPSQGHCTEVRFIDRSTVERTRAVTCTVVEVNSSLTVIVTVFGVVIVWELEVRGRGSGAFNRLSPDFDCFHSESVRLNL